MKDPLGETKTIKISYAQPENTEKKKKGHWQVRALTSEKELKSKEILNRAILERKYFGGRSRLTVTEMETVW